VSLAKLEIVTTCPEIDQVDDENPERLDKLHVPVVSVNSLGNVTTMLAADPVVRAVCVCKLKLKSTESSTEVLVALIVGEVPSERAPAVAVTVSPVDVDSYKLLLESYKATVKLLVVAMLGGLSNLAT
jgi:hypothetical protein